MQLCYVFWTSWKTGPIYLQLEPEQQPYQALEKDTAEQVAI